MSESTRTAPAVPTRIPLAITRWKGGKLHVTRDGVKTACGALIPAAATRTVATVEWYLHTTCYNCAYRLWPEQGPADYICPTDSSDFPPQRMCPHGRRSATCVRCTPRVAQNWPCPNGCTDPVDHDPIRRYTKCAVLPPHRAVGPDGRCAEGCESTEKARHRANSGMYFDLADSASMTCYHCGNPVCVSCQTAPVDDSLTICDGCVPAGW